MANINPLVCIAPLCLSQLINIKRMCALCVCGHVTWWKAWRWAIKCLFWLPASKNCSLIWRPLKDSNKQWKRLMPKKLKYYSRLNKVYAGEVKSWLFISAHVNVWNFNLLHHHLSVLESLALGLKLSLVPIVIDRVNVIDRTKPVHWQASEKWTNLLSRGHTVHIISALLCWLSWQMYFFVGKIWSTSVLVSISSV